MAEINGILPVNGALRVLSVVATAVLVLGGVFGTVISIVSSATDLLEQKIESNDSRVSEVAEAFTTLKSVETRIEHLREITDRDRSDIKEALVSIEQRELRSLSGLNGLVAAVDEKLQKEIEGLEKVIENLDTKLQQEQRLRVETLKTATAGIDALSKGRHDQVLIHLGSIRESSDIQFKRVWDEIKRASSVRPALFPRTIGAY